MNVPTPLIPLGPIDPGIYAKVEYLHPSGSLKHRAIPGGCAP
jgi:cysteine synthase